MKKNYILLYVEHTRDSATFYRALLEREPFEDSPTFVAFALNDNLILGLWSKASIHPAPPAPGGSEFGIQVGSAAEVDSLCITWKHKGARIVQEPRTVDFGRTFLALDPDGHRLRVFSAPDAT